jgi:uncharacterized protein
MNCRIAGIASALIALLAFASPVFAQKPAPTAPPKASPAPPAKPTPVPTPIPPAQAAAVAELFRVMKMQSEVQQMPEAMIASEISRNPGLARFRDVMLGWLKKYMTWDAMSPELTKLYAANFTEAELKEMTAFYKTPTGQKALAKMPEMGQRSAMIGAQLGQAHSEELKKAMTARSEELKEEHEKLEKSEKPQAGAAAKGTPQAPRRQPTSSPKNP